MVKRAKIVRRKRSGFRGNIVHVNVVRSGKWFVAECVEIAVVTQGRSLDETAEALRQAVSLHLEGEDTAALGLTAAPRLVLRYETVPPNYGAPA